MGVERREQRRVFVGPDHTVRFSVRGHGYRNVRITNLSSGGCFATLLRADVALFIQGTLLEQFAFEHPDLPDRSFMAHVAYVLGAEPGGDFDQMGLGIQFAAPPPEIQSALDLALERLAGR